MLKNGLQGRQLLYLAKNHIHKKKRNSKITKQNKNKPDLHTKMTFYIN